MAGYVSPPRDTHHHISFLFIFDLSTLLTFAPYASCLCDMACQCTCRVTCYILYIILILRRFNNFQNICNPILIRSNKMQQYAGIYLLQNHSKYFGCPSHPLSGVHKTVTAASGTGHNNSATTFLQRGLLAKYSVCSGSYTYIKLN